MGWAGPFAFDLSLYDWLVTTHAWLVHLNIINIRINSIFSYMWPTTEYKIIDFLYGLSFSSLSDSLTSFYLDFSFATLFFCSTFCSCASFLTCRWTIFLTPMRLRKVDGVYIYHEFMILFGILWIFCYVIMLVCQFRISTCAHIICRFGAVLESIAV